MLQYGLLLLVVSYPVVSKQGFDIIVHGISVPCYLHFFASLCFHFPTINLYYFYYNYDYKYMHRMAGAASKAAETRKLLSNGHKCL